MANNYYATNPTTQRSDVKQNGAIKCADKYISTIANTIRDYYDKLIYDIESKTLYKVNYLRVYAKLDPIEVYANMHNFIFTAINKLYGETVGVDYNTLTYSDFINAYNTVCMYEAHVNAKSPIQTVIYHGDKFLNFSDGIYDMVNIQEYAHSADYIFSYSIPATRKSFFDKVIPALNAVVDNINKDIDDCEKETLGEVMHELARFIRWAFDDVEDEVGYFTGEMKNKFFRFIRNINNQTICVNIQSMCDQFIESFTDAYISEFWEDEDYMDFGDDFDDSEDIDDSIL